jgi:hypothetical protein
MVKGSFNRYGGIVAGIFGIVWTIAMINLWEWNVDGTGGWFAFMMVFAGCCLTVAGFAHSFKWWEKFRAKFIDKKE